MSLFLISSRDFSILFVSIAGWVDWVGWVGFVGCWGFLALLISLVFVGLFGWLGLAGWAGLFISFFTPALASLLLLGVTVFGFLGFVYSPFSSVRNASSWFVLDRLVHIPSLYKNLTGILAKIFKKEFIRLGKYISNKKILRWNLGIGTSHILWLAEYLGPFSPGWDKGHRNSRATLF